MKKQILTLCMLILHFIYLNAQINKGINFQGVARSNNGIILANKMVNLRLTIKTDSINGAIEYQEIKSITTNTIGLFSVVVGSKQDRTINSFGNFEDINWSNTEKFLQVEVDITGELYFSNLGIQKINYVPYAFYADKIDAANIDGIIGVNKGGTGFDNIKGFKIMAALDKVNNTPDSLKPISLYTLMALNEKLKKTDTHFLSNRIELKLNKTDTQNISNRMDLKLNKLDTNHLSNRINQKLNISDTFKMYNKINAIPILDTTSMSQRINLKLNKSDTISLSNRINNKISISGLTPSDITNALNYIPVPNDYGNFYDTAKQSAPIATATVVKFNFKQLANNIAITNNTSGLPTRITANYAGLYNIKYTLQFIKTDAANDEVSVWIRRNSSAYANTNNMYTIVGLGIKNTVSNSFFIELGDDDYIEIYFSIKNINTSLSATNAQLTPSRPATPAAMVSIQRIN